MNAPDGPTKDELYERATELDIQGRSDMTKDELQRAIDEETDGQTTAAASPSSPTAPPPPPADQPGVGRAANPERDDRLGPTPSMTADRIGRRTEAARDARREAREESVSGSEG